MVDNANVKREHNHTSIHLMMGGIVGVKDMLMDGTMRLAVRTPGTGDAAGLGSAYLTEDECVLLLRELLPGHAVVTRSDLMTSIELIDNAYGEQPAAVQRIRSAIAPHSTP